MCTEASWLSKFMHFVASVVKSLDGHFLLVRGEPSVGAIPTASTLLPVAVVVVTVVMRVRRHSHVLQFELRLLRRGRARGVDHWLRPAPQKMDGVLGLHQMTLVGQVFGCGIATLI